MTPSRGRVFVDESKQGDYLLVAAAFTPRDVPQATQELRQLLRPGQGRLHMRKESNPARKALLSTICAMPGVQVTIFQAGRGYRTEGDRRDQCLRELVRLSGVQRYDHLVLERDETRERTDRQLLHRELSAAGLRDLVRYEHAHAVAQPLLSVPDAIAWAYAKGGDWKRRCEPVVTDVIKV